MYKVNFYNKNTGAEYTDGDIKGTRQDAIAKGRATCKSADGWMVLSVINNSFMVQK